MNRGLSPAQIVRAGLRRLPEVLECRRRFANWAEFARLYAGMAEMRPPFVAVGREGFTLEHREAADLATSWQIFCARSYYVPRGAKVVLDLGANIGMFSVYAARVARAQRVIAFEPVVATFARLQANLARNALSQQVEVHQLGIGGSAGLRSIDLGSSSVHACMFPRNDPRFECGQCEMITVTTLDLLFARLGLDQVDMCKMDCEGGEVEAIMAARDETLRRIGALSLEYHFYNAATLEADERELFRRIEAAGFRCTGRKAGAIVAHFERVGPAPPPRPEESVSVAVTAPVA